jgi:hypothetical protein
VTFGLLVTDGCSAQDRVIAASAALDQDGRAFSVDPPMVVRGHFNDICIGLPEGSNVDFQAGAVVLPTSERARVSASLWTNRGERVDLTHLSMETGVDGKSACVSTPSDMQGGRYGRVTITSSAPFTSPRIRWRSTDKL